MINTILVFDEQDNILGDFFQLCQEDLKDFFSTKEIETEIISSQILSNLTVQLKIESFNKKPYVFAVFTHGDSKNLLKSGTNSFISVGEGLNIFKDSFFYTSACETGKTLGKKLINAGCKCFIGYKDKIHIWSTDKIPFVKTATYGLKLFYEGKNASTIFAEMKTQYNKQIDILYEANSVIASILMENRDALVCFGDDINITDMLITNLKDNGSIK